MNSVYATAIDIHLAIHSEMTTDNELLGIGHFSWHGYPEPNDIPYSRRWYYWSM